MIENISVPRISNLPNLLSNQIAAGEVIERPASVVKELVENSIDSQATRIDISIYSGGTERIIIKDNGHGIHPDDMELAILRHATSKLHTQKDLDEIISLGFRGEALSSIAAVSDFCITSRIASKDHAIKMSFNPHNSIPEVYPAARDIGTTVEVCKLFQPLPVRRKFLRSDKTEFIHIQNLIKCFILSQFDINITLNHNGKLIFNYPAVGEERQIRISRIMGRNFYDRSWRIDTQVDDMYLWGWLGNEDCARNQTDRQYFFLNNRIIKDKNISHAIRKAMVEIVPDTKYPSYVLHLSINPSSVDVNVHPTKREVRFKKPRDIHDFIFAVLNTATSQELSNRPQAEVKHDSYLQNLILKNKVPTFDADQFKNFYLSNHKDKFAESVTNNPLGEPFEILYKNYLLTKYNDDIRIVDYNNLKRHYLSVILEKQLTDSKLVSRPLLVPLMLTFKRSIAQKIIENKESFERLGIMLLQSGPQTISIRSIPSSLPNLDVNSLFSHFIKMFEEKKIDCDEIVSNGLSIMIDVQCFDERYQYSLKEIEQELPLLLNLKLPYADKQFSSIWNTILETDLMNLVNNKN